MKPEVKVIYSSMLTRQAYDAKPVPEYVSKVISKYNHVLDVKKTEFENVQLLLEAMINGLQG